MSVAESKARDGILRGNQNQKLGASPNWAATRGRAAEWEHRAGWIWGNQTERWAGEGHEPVGFLGLRHGAGGSEAICESHQGNGHPQGYTSAEVDPSLQGRPQSLASVSQHAVQFGNQEALLYQGICQSPLIVSRKKRSIFKGSELRVAGLGLCCHDSAFPGSP